MKRFARPKPLSEQTSQIKPISKLSGRMPLGWSVLIIAASGGGYAVWQNVPLSDLALPSLIIGLLLCLTLVRAADETPLRNFSGLLMVAAFATAFAAFLSKNGFSLIGVELALLVSALALFAGWITKSKTIVLLSAFSGVLYLASSNPELGIMTGLTEQASQLGAGVLPWLILGQIILAQKLRSSIVLLSSLIAGYFWLATLATEIPFTAFAALGLSIAAAQYWLGKAWTETGVFGGNLHKSCAWVIGLGAALSIQSNWLNADIGKAEPFWLPTTLWWLTLACSIFTVFTVSLMRYKTSHLSLSGIFIICFAVLALPMAAARPDLVFTLFDSIPGLNARPGFGLIIGATIIATGFIWLIGGLKRGSLLDMCLGAITIGLQAILLFQPERFDMDLGVTFIVSLICALCIGGLMTGSSPDRNPSAHIYA